MKSKMFLLLLLLVQSHMILSSGKFILPKQSKILAEREVKRISELVTNYLQETINREKPTLSDYFIAKLFFIVLHQMKGQPTEAQPPSYWLIREGR
jgi:hypothetical protein